MSNDEYGQELREIVDRMKTLGFYYRVSNKKGAKFYVYFEEKGNRPDPIIQTGKDMDLLKATKYAALNTIDFINMIGPNWKTRPVKEGCENVSS